MHAWSDRWQRKNRIKIANLKKQLQKYQGAPRMSPPPEPEIEDEEIVKKN